jgi:hypothetical protein
MEKVIALVWGPGDGESGDALRHQLIEDTVPRLRRSGARGVTINVHDSAADPAPSPAPPPEGEHLPTASYLVVESLYDDYGTTPYATPRDWPDGERSPGVLTVALIHRPEGLDYKEWITRWHGTQSPVSGELQPRTRYVRNEVLRSLTEGAPEIDGIVEEGWPSVDHVADPKLFFNAANDEELGANVTRMLESVSSCLDLARLRSSTMSEYLVAPLY